MRRDILIPATLVPLLTLGAAVHAEERSLECRLYIGLGTENVDAWTSESAERTFETRRRSAVCVFPDGSVADKQFVMIGTFAGDGAAGVNRGYSLYTFEDGDSLTLAFEGRWGADGYAGDYEVLAGTGAYEGANGTGTISGVASPWQGTGIVDIAIDVTLSDS